MSSYLITGASRGLGLELTRQLAQPGRAGVVFAAARGSAPALDALAAQSGGRVVVVRVDLAEPATAAAAAAEVEKHLGGAGLDVLINNAGIYETSKDVFEMDNLMSSFKINVIGTHEVTRAFVPLLRRGTAKKVVNISTAGGSIALFHMSKAYPAAAYKISKSALNALTVQQALELEDDGFTVVALNPGNLQTDLSGGTGDLSVEVGATAVLDLVGTITKEQNGKFVNVTVPGWEAYNGSEIPW